MPAMQWQWEGIGREVARVRAWSHTQASHPFTTSLIVVMIHLEDLAQVQRRRHGDRSFVVSERAEQQVGVISVGEPGPYALPPGERDGLRDGFLTRADTELVRGRGRAKQVGDVRIAAPLADNDIVLVWMDHAHAT